MRVPVDGSTVFVGGGNLTPAPAVERPALLFLHGAGMDHTVWTLPVRHFLRHGHPVVAPDLPAHGRSAGAPLADIEALAAWAWRLLDALAIDRAVLFGHSMGTLIAQAMAASRPERVLGLGLLGTSAPMRVAAPLLAAAGDDHPAAFDMANTWSHSLRGRLGGNPQPGMWLIASGQRLLARNRPGVYAADLAACNGYAPTAADKPLHAPVLVVAGEADQMTPLTAGLAAAAGYPACEVVRLPGTGHAMLGEQPNAVLDALAGLVRRVTAPR